MNKQLIRMLTAVTALALTGGVARATLYSYTFSSGFTGGSTVADGNPAGWTDSRGISDITGGDAITSINVRLNTTGGYNGDMYGYLVLTDTSTHAVLGFSTLLNRVGTGSGSEPQFSFGFSTAGFNNVTFSDGAGSGIHDAADPTGGTYTTDGGSLANFASANANNTWTLFLADESTGGVMQVSDWGLDINVVPEPVTWAIVIFGAFVAGFETRRRLRISKEVLVD